jgi:hypothetical protein
MSGEGDLAWMGGNDLHIAERTDCRSVFGLRNLSNGAFCGHVSLFASTSKFQGHNTLSAISDWVRLTTMDDHYQTGGRERRKAEGGWMNGGREKERLKPEG